MISRLLKCPASLSKEPKEYTTLLLFTVDKNASPAIDEITMIMNECLVGISMNFALVF